jgi:hypothetical protein
MIEQMMCDGQERRAFRNGTPEFDAQVQALRQQFGAVDPSAWFSVSTPQHNAIYGDDIVSVVFAAIPPYLDGFDLGAVGRKYFVGKGWVYDKVYLYLPPGTCPLPVPPGGRGMWLGKLVNVYGQPGDADLTRYQCLYFMHPDHAAVEAWAGQTLPQGHYSTFYAATFDTQDGNRLMRMKTYCYHEQGELFSDWDVTYLQHCKKRGLLEAIE